MKTREGKKNKIMRRNILRVFDDRRFFTLFLTDHEQLVVQWLKNSQRMILTKHYVVEINGNQKEKKREKNQQLLTCEIIKLSFFSFCSLKKRETDRKAKRETEKNKFDELVQSRTLCFSRKKLNASMNHVLTIRPMNSIGRKNNI